MQPSISRCGFFCMRNRSLYAPGSDSSALQQRYLSIAPFGMNDAFLPMAKPAPPRPRSPDSSSSLSTAAASISSRALRIAP
jgi:hypothetical protein